MSTTPRILVADPEESHRDPLAARLLRAGYTVDKVATLSDAIGALSNGTYAVVLVDASLGGRKALDVLKHAKELPKPPSVMFVSSVASIEDAVESMHRGAAYYFTKPLDHEHVRKVVDAEVARRRSSSQPAARPIEREPEAAPTPVVTRPVAVPPGKDRGGLGEIVATTNAMERIFELVSTVAPTNATALILGESGTGKELVARAIHGLSPRKNRPFVALNCAALSEHLLESELFGHEKGAFTGAVGNREGRFEFADGGTLFLDEVGDMPLPVQVKLLRVLQERKITRVGSNEPIAVDVRLIAATNKDLEQEVKKGTFRQDLYYRLKVFAIHLPALRERRGDIPFLVERFIQQFAERHGKPVVGIEPDALRILMQHDWPGNVRELENVIESMVLVARGDHLRVDDIVPGIPDSKSASALVPFETFEGMTLERVEQELIRANLKRFDGNRAKVARALGISERTLYRKLREYGFAKDP